MTTGFRPSLRTVSPPAGPAIEITLNGAATKVAAALTVEGLVAEMIEGAPKGVAVAINDRVAPRAQWAQHKIAAGDVVEIVRATQGG
jgi:sulfur carrier protein